jgi:glycosyltransferase involved in cell wall biosynthesis
MGPAQRRRVSLDVAAAVDELARVAGVDSTRLGLLVEQDTAADAIEAVGGDERVRALAVLSPRHPDRVAAAVIARGVPVYGMASIEDREGLRAAVDAYLAAPAPQSRIDVFHGTNFEAPYLPLRPSLLTLHDLSPWLNPVWHNSADRVRRRTPFLIGLGLTTLVLTPSEAVRRQAMDHFRIPPQRIVAIPEAAPAHLRPVESRPERPYFLYVGALEPRKNIHMLVEVWRAARRRAQVDLVLAGRRREDFPLPPPEPGLVIRGEVSELDLSKLYSGALAFVYPSLYDGFGLPVLEAMQCGAAVITSRDPAISEIASGAALQLDARDPGAWAEALAAAAAGPEWLAKLQAASLARAREFSWGRTARLTREAYTEAVRRALP